jgi:hypothetical protein
MDAFAQIFAAERGRWRMLRKAERQVNMVNMADYSFA